MKSILEDIKNNEFKTRLSVLRGGRISEKQYRDKLSSAWLPEDDTMNRTVFRGKGVSPGEVIDLGETLPFGTEQGDHPGGDGIFKGQCEKLPEYLSQLPDYLYLLFVEEEIDKRSRMYKAVKNTGKIAEFARQNEGTLMRWVLGTLKKEGRKITKQDMELFLLCTGNDMYQIENELEKLLAYTADAM